MRYPPPNITSSMSGSGSNKQTTSSSMLLQAKQTKEEELEEEEEDEKDEEEHPLLPPSASASVSDPSSSAATSSSSSISISISSSMSASNTSSVKGSHNKATAAAAGRLEEHWCVVRVPSTGLRHFTGISSCYSTHYPLVLQGVISQKEFVDVIERLNETIRDYWPCDTCYYFGYGCSICSFGLTILLPHYCASHSEVYATAMLRNVTLKSKFYDRRISFCLVKKWFESFVEIKIPLHLMDVQLMQQYQHEPYLSTITTISNTYDDLEQHTAVPSPTKGGMSPIGRVEAIDRSLDNNFGMEIGPFLRPPSSMVQLLSDDNHLNSTYKKAL